MRLLISLLFAISPTLASATAILGFRTPNQIILAADSLRGEINAQGIRTGTTLACKIHGGQHGIYIAAAGTGFYLGARRIAFERLLPTLQFAGKTNSKRVQDAITEIQAEILGAWDTAWRADHQFFADVILGHAFQLIFGWGDFNELGAASYSVIPLAGGHWTDPQSAIYPNDGAPANTPFVWMVGGTSKIMEQRLTAISNGNAPLPKDLPAFAASLIQLEIDADAMPHSVGPPIDVLVIDKTGPHWYRRDPKSKCEELHGK